MPLFFTPTCSLPPESTRFTSTPNVRGTLDIVWTLLQHPPPLHMECPAPEHPAPGQAARRRAVHPVAWCFSSSARRNGCLLTLMAPEILIGLALSQFVAAKHGQDIMQGFACEDGVEWTREHSHFADMGGFVISFPDDSAARGSTGDTKSDTATAEEDELHYCDCCSVQRQYRGKYVEQACNELSRGSTIPSPRGKSAP